MRGRRRVAIASILMWGLVGASAAVADESPPAPSKPQNLSPPVISGAPEPGKVLTASPGTWTESPTAYSYEWERCIELISQQVPPELSCSPIPGATAGSYSVTQADVYRKLRVRVTALHGFLAGAPAFSAPTDLVGLHLVPEVIATAALLPLRLPRTQQASAALRLGFTSQAANPPGVPQLGAISFELSRNLRLHTAGFASCPIERLYHPAAARGACAHSIVGHGTVDSEVLIEGEEVPIEGRMIAFYELKEGQPRILGQVTATHGATRLIYVLPFRVERERGRYRTRLSIPQMHFVLGVVIRGAYAYTFPYGYGRISNFSLSMKRSFKFAGRRRSFVTASCPAPAGMGGMNFPLVRTTLDYAESGSFPYQRPNGITSEKQGSVLANCRVIG